MEPKHKKIAIIGGNDDLVHAMSDLSKAVNDYNVLVFKSIDDIPKHEREDYNTVDLDTATFMVDLMNANDRIEASGGYTINSNITHPKKKRKKNKKTHRR